MLPRLGATPAGLTFSILCGASSLMWHSGYCEHSHSALPLLCSCSQDNSTGVLEANSKFGVRVDLLLSTQTHVVESYFIWLAQDRAVEVIKTISFCAHVMEKRHVCTSPFPECLHFTTPAVTEVCRSQAYEAEGFQASGPRGRFPLPITGSPMQRKLCQLSLQKEVDEPFVSRTTPRRRASRLFFFCCGVQIGSVVEWNGAFGRQWETGLAKSQQGLALWQFTASTLRPMPRQNEAITQASGIHDGKARGREAGGRLRRYRGSLWPAGHGTVGLAARFREHRHRTGHRLVVGIISQSQSFRTACCW